MELRPFYQRRPRWDKARQSKLIESFIMNVPVPPLFVYESDLAKYEVMDGQQRITALLDFYTNKLTLEGLEQRGNPRRKTRGHHRKHEGTLCSPSTGHVHRTRQHQKRRPRPDQPLREN